ncbi:MAG: DUF1549 domain-containing protein [Deltaproteobacteria bacterium]|nr:MAG: DUF1549 domain-containing protein [Deltaproteobacteria bacterium]
MRRRQWLIIAFAVGIAGPALTVEGSSIEELIRAYLAERGADVQLAPPEQLARRYSIDLTGVVPTPEDIEATASMSPAEMFDYFAAKGPMDHTGGEIPYVWVNLLKDADHFLFSNSTQFSQRAHILEFRDQLRRVYAEGWSYQEFVRWALQSQMFLNRFPSAADRANAAFFLFLGRDSFASEVPAGNMWNGWQLRNPNIPASQAETNPDYHVYDYDPANCERPGIVCSAQLWSSVGATPEDAIEMIVSSPLFAEATVDHYWYRFIGQNMPGVDFPDLRRALAKGFIEHNYDVNWLIREITTSPAYTQEMMFR